MSVAIAPSNVLAALIEEARRRARRRRTFFAVLAFVVAAGAGAAVGGGAPFAGSRVAAGTPLRPVVLPTNWTERQEFANHAGVVRLRVRTIEFVGASWRASVGITNLSSRPITLSVHDRRQHASGIPLSYVAAPGIWWTTYHRGGNWLPNTGWSETRVTRATAITPRYPERLAPRATWFGVFRGSAATLPSDHLLSIGFGVACACPANYEHRTAISTTHTFTLPRR